MLSHPLPTEDEDDEDGDVHENEDDDDDEDDDPDAEPLLEYKFLRHDGAVNRIRVMPQGPGHIAATWADTGKVHLWDLTAAVSELDGQSGTTCRFRTRAYARASWG